MIMNIIGIIPARYASSRFPGKPLAIINGKSMIQRVYTQASKSGSLFRVVVATDDERIFNHVIGFGGEAMMTRESHANGTSRCLEVLSNLEKGKLEINIDAVINIQGDEPFIQPEQIDLVASLFSDSRTDIATLVKSIDNSTDIFDPNTVKAVIDRSGFALYFSRQAIPYNREQNPNNWMNESSYFKHIGIYGYRTRVLEKIVSLQPSPLETTEKLEQLRWLENGFKVKVKITELDSNSVDTPDDLEKFINKS